MKKLVALLPLALAAALFAGGTVNTVPKFISSSKIGDSALSDNGSVVNSTQPLTAPSITTTGDGSFSTVKVTGIGSPTRNVGVGQSVFASLTTGESLTALGYAALYSNTSGSFNTALGTYAMVFTNSGSYNTAVGRYSLYENYTGNHNTALGYDTLSFLDLGDHNTAVGSFALHNVGDTVAGHDNTGIGYMAGTGVTLPNNLIQKCTFLGASADSTDTDAYNSMALGYLARVDKSSQVVVGNANVTETILRGNVIYTTGTVRNIRPADGDGVIFGGGTYPDAVIGASWGWGLDAYGMSLGGSYFNSFGQMAFNTDGDNQAAWMGADTDGGRIELFDGTGSSVQTTFVGNFGVSISTHVTPLAASPTRAVLFSSGAASAEMWVRDGAGNDTQISPHDPVTGKWRFLSCNDQLGRCYEVPDMEKLVAIVEKMSGVSLHREWEK